MKSGIDYFPLDVALDEKFELIEAEFGLTGFGVVVKLLQKIYGGQGYYVEWTNEVALLFAKRIGLGGSAVSEIVEASVKRGIFDKTLYEKYRVLTSKGIQKRYFEAVARRKSVEVEGAYLLVNATDFLKNVSILKENADISPENADISQQSKVEESRVEKSREKKSNARAREDTTALDRFIRRWEINASGMDNYSAGKVAGIDWDALSAKVERSAYLQQQKSLTFYIRHAGEIAEGYYDDFRKPPHGPPDAQAQQDAERERRLAEYDAAMAKRRGGEKR